VTGIHRFGRALVSIPLHWRILTGLLLGAGTGLAWGPRAAGLGSIGDVFLRALNMVVVPLIATSIVSGVAGLGSGRRLGRLGLRTMVWYLTTSLLAILTGLLLVDVFRPGVGAELGLPAAVPEGVDRPIDSVTDFLMRLIPRNPVEAMATGQILPVIFFSILFGAFTARLPDGKREPMVGWFDAAFEVMLGVTRLVIAFAPIGVFGLVARTTAQVGLAPFRSLGFYALVVLLGLAVHFFATLPLLHWLLTRRNPYVFLRRMSPALLMGFSTASSSATLPVTLDCAENRAGVSPGVASFVLPLGATVNMDGTALYECVAALFITQFLGLDLSFGQQFLVVVTSLLASIGAAGIPMAGLVMIGVILGALGVDVRYIGLVVAIDPFLDMCRTSVNIWSDANGAFVVAAAEGEVREPGAQ
jgi:Na+/H+-dicarboxylate symporter